MKRLVSIVIIFVCLSSKAQYKKLIFDNLHFWNETDMLVNPVGPGNTGYCALYHQVIYLKDTLLNTKNYHKLKRIGMGSNFWSTGNAAMSCLSNSGNTVYRYLRQDTLLRKVWRLKADFSNEDLLYDFSKVNVNDTIKNILIHDAFAGTIFVDYVIQSIDSTIYGDNLYHKKFHYKSINNTHFINAIQGIGYESGLFTSSQVSFVSQYGVALNCFSKLTTPPLAQNIYNNGNNQGMCYFMTVNVDETKLKEIKFNLFPNPANNKLQIQTNGEEIEQIIIRNVLGQEVLRIENSNETDISLLNSGIYLLILKTQSGSGSKRFVVSR